MEQDAALEAVFMPVQPPSTFEETVERLRTAILLRPLAPGRKPPPAGGGAHPPLAQPPTSLDQRAHRPWLRGRKGAPFVAEDPPLVNPIGEPLDGGAWEVL